VSRAVPELTDAIAGLGGVRIAIISQGWRGEPVVASSHPSVTQSVAETRSGALLAMGVPFRRALGRMLTTARPAIIHDHGLWLATNHHAARFARVHRIPFVVQPHGMLEPWALGYRGAKKRAAMRLYQRADLESARVLVVTSEAEGENLRRIGLAQPLAVIPNGVGAELLAAAPPAAAGRRDGRRNVLFLSRIHEKKGLLNLVRAWARLRVRDWELRLAGPDDVGHLNEVLQLARELGVSDAVRYLGVLEGEQKTALYRQADLFVLPTFSENFGLVVAEALACGVPVITTRGAPWADLERLGCGWWIDVGVEPLVRALDTAMALTVEERAAMGERARVLARRFDWRSIAGQMQAVYKWILKDGPRPACVVEV
jgi:glycosyltransferase involved in cell wall biosynthesis